jgi:hypothetical protein
VGRSRWQGLGSKCHWEGPRTEHCLRESSTSRSGKGSFSGNDMAIAGFGASKNRHGRGLTDDMTQFSVMMMACNATLAQHSTTHSTMHPCAISVQCSVPAGLAKQRNGISKPANACQQHATLQLSECLTNMHAAAMLPYSLRTHCMLPVTLPNNPSLQGACSGVLDSCTEHAGQVASQQEPLWVLGAHFQVMSAGRLFAAGPGRARHAAPTTTATAVARLLLQEH